MLVVALFSQRMEWIVLSCEVENLSFTSTFGEVRVKSFMSANSSTSFCEFLSINGVVASCRLYIVIVSRGKVCHTLPKKGEVAASRIFLLAESCLGLWTLGTITYFKCIRIAFFTAIPSRDMSGINRTHLGRKNFKHNDYRGIERMRIFETFEMCVSFLRNSTLRRAIES